MTISPIKTSGRKKWRDFHGTKKELEKASRLTKQPIRGKGNQEPHIHVTENQAVRLAKLFLSIWA